MATTKNATAEQAATSSTPTNGESTRTDGGPRAKGTTRAGESTARKTRSAAAADGTPAFVGPSAEDQAAVWAIPARVVAAWAEHNAEAFAGVFTENGTMILPGLYRKGRDEIRLYMKAAFADTYKGTRVTGQPINIEFLGKDAVLLITQGGVLYPGEAKVSDLRAIRASWLVVKQDGLWQLAAYQNSPHAT